MGVTQLSMSSRPARATNEACLVRLGVKKQASKPVTLSGRRGHTLLCSKYVVEVRVMCVFFRPDV